MNTPATGATAPKIPAISSTTQLTQAFIALCGSFALNFSLDGKSSPELDQTKLSCLVMDCTNLLEIAEKHHAESVQRDRDFMRALFESVPVEGSAI